RFPCHVGDGVHLLAVGVREEHPREPRAQVVPLEGVTQSGGRRSVRADAHRLTVLAGLFEVGLGASTDEVLLRARGPPGEAGQARIAPRIDLTPPILVGVPPYRE